VAEIPAPGIFAADAQPMSPRPIFPRPTFPCPIRNPVGSIRIDFGLSNPISLGRTLAPGSAPDILRCLGFPADDYATDVSRPVLPRPVPSAADISPNISRPDISRPIFRGRCFAPAPNISRPIFPADISRPIFRGRCFAADVPRPRPIFRGQYFTAVLRGRYFAADISLPRPIFRSRFPSANISAADLFPTYGSAMDDSRFTTSPRCRCSRADPYSLPCAPEVFFLG
jgi:hypothetical protein